MYSKNYSPGFVLLKFLLTILAAGCLFLAMMPVIAADFIDLYFLGLLSLAIFSILNLSTRAGMTMFVIASSGALALAVGVFATSSSMMHSDRYRDLLGKETAGDFSDVLPPIDIDQAPLVSQDMALYAMQKRLSDVSTLGSQVSVGESPVKQIVDGKLVWVSFLQHRSLFKWMSASGTPGYVVVSAHDPSDVKLVTEIDGAKLNLKYLPSSYFGEYIKRHAYFAGVMNSGLTDFLAEIDESGRPFYVATRYKHSIGFSGSEADGVVTIDAQTGDLKVYSLANIPTWIDRIQPAAFVRDQMADRGNLIHGYFNVSDQDRMTVNGDLDLVYGSDKRSYWVGGMASIGRNSGLSGFYFVDTKTKKLIWYKVPSVSQATAASAAEKVNPEKHYAATNPLPFLVAGAPTYVMALRDDLGIARAYGMVDMRNHQILAVGDTLNATLRVYQAKRSTDRVSADISAAVKETTIDGVVIRTASEFRNGQTSFFVTIKHNDVVLGNIFTGTSDLSEELVLTLPGDRVVITYGDGSSRVVSMSKFRNLEIPGRDGEVLQATSAPADVSTEPQPSQSNAVGEGPAASGTPAVGGEDTSAGTKAPPTMPPALPDDRRSALSNLSSTETKQPHARVPIFGASKSN